MTPDDLQVQLAELETRVDRLRALYEQFFTGLEKLEPHVQKKDVERRFDALRRLQIRNTATRFRFQSLVQRYTTYLTYWQRIARQIEEGTFKRDVVRAQRYGNKPAAPKPAEEEIYELDVELTELEPDEPAPAAAPPASPAPAAPRPSATTTGPHAAATRQRELISLDDLDDLGDLDNLAKAPPPVVSPRPAAPTAVARPRITDEIPMEFLEAMRFPTPVGVPPAPTAATAPRAPAPPLPPRATPATGPRPAVPPRAAPNPGEPAGPPRPVAQVRPPTGLTPARPAPAVPNAPRPQPPAPRPEGANSDDPAVRTLYERYRTARRNNGEGDVSFDAVARQVRDTLPRLAARFPGQDVSLDVATKDGKTVLRPVVRPKR